MFRFVSAALLFLFAFAGSDAHSALSSPVYNGRIAFTSNTTGIASMNPDGSGQWGADLQPYDAEPAWSPDGTKLAVVTGSGNGIESLQPNGDALGMLTRDPGDAYPAWSPDGSMVAFANGANIWLVNADGSERRQLTSETEGYAARPTWSADQKTIAFAAERDDASSSSSTLRVYAVDVATGKEQPLTSARESDSSPAWSPDGKTILFTGWRDASQGIFGMNPDGTSIRQITTTSRGADDAAWSPDGTQIAFSGDTFSGRSQIWVMSADGSNEHRLSTGLYPAWQPLGPPPHGCTLWGTSANDLLVGTDSNDTICGLDGNDSIIGGAGNDVISGGAGNDSIAAGTGHDVISGGPGNDTIDARNGRRDLIYGGPGFDAAIIGDPTFTFISGIERRRVDHDLAAWMPATADAYAPTGPPQMAFDGLMQDFWNAGDNASHWVEVDLQDPRSIARVRLMAPRVDFDTTLLLLGRSADDQPFRLLHTFTGPFADQQEVDYTPKHPWRSIRYLRLQVGSVAYGWTSWREIEVYPPAPNKPKKKP